MIRIFKIFLGVALISAALYQLKNLQSVHQDKASFGRYVAQTQDVKKDYYNDLYKKIEDYKKTPPTTMAERQKQVEELIQSDDGHLKELALNEMKFLPPSNKNMELLHKHVFAFHDPFLIPSAVLNLRRHQNISGYEGVVSNLVHEVFTQGSVFVQEELAKNISPLMSQQLKEEISQLLPSMPKYSKAREILRQQMNTQMEHL